MNWVRIILLQLAVAVATALVAAFLGGVPAGTSSILAGLSCIVPNVLFAFGMHMENRLQLQSGLAVFYAMELMKVLLTTLLVVAVFWLYKDVNWLSFLISFVVSLKSYIFLLSRSNN